jgi:hypothetical protein
MSKKKARPGGKFGKRSGFERDRQQGKCGTRKTYVFHTGISLVEVHESQGWQVRPRSPAGRSTFRLQFNEVVCTHYRAEFACLADGAIRVVVPPMMDFVTWPWAVAERKRKWE